MDSPRFPWEVIERIIGHSGDHPNTLYSLSCTCRQLRPRALCVMVARVTLKSRDRIFDFCAVLHAKPHLKTLVRSAVVDPTDFAPIPFLRILPNLSELRFTSKETIIALHQSNLTCFRHYGTHVQALHLSNVSFSTYLPLARLLLAFTNLAHLTCTDITIATSERQLPHLGVLRQRLAKRLQLRSLAIDPSSPIRWESHDPSMEGLLFGPDLALTLESLDLKLTSGGLSNDSWRLLAQIADWSRLQSLVLQVPHENSGYLPWAIGVLESAYGPTLKEVTLVLGPVSSIPATAKGLSLADTHANNVYHKLEYTLLKFPQPKLTWVAKIPIRPGRTSFWMRELGRRFPILSQRGLLALKSETVVDSPIPYGHDGALRALAIDPTGKWVASGSDDFTIILWDATNGHMAYQWVPHEYNSVVSLAFSPDGLYLVSGGHDARLVIWDLSAHTGWKVATLEGHTAPISSCAWSPCGATIASGSFDGTVVVWDAHTFAKRHLLKKSPSRFEARYVSFSPDGRSLASWFFPCGYCLWDVASGALHKLVQPDPARRVQRLDIAAAFDPGSLHLATVSRRDGVEVWAVETGVRRVVLRHAGEVQDVSFSPSGRLLVTASSDRTVRIWDACTGVELLRLLGHTNIVSKACFSPCEKYVASGAWDGMVRVWSASDGSSVASFSEHEECVSHLFFSPDGTTLWSGEKNGSIVYRSLHDIVPVDE